VILSSNFSSAQSLATFGGVNVAAYIVNNDNKEITNGEYEIRFAIYSKDRDVTDPYK